MQSALPMSEPLTTKSVLNQGRKLFQSSLGQYIALVLLAFGIPALIRITLRLTLFPEGGIRLGGGVFPFLGQLWWNLGVETAVSLALFLFEIFWVVGLIAGAGTLISANRLHGEVVSIRHILPEVLRKNGASLTLSYFFAFLVFVALILFTFFGMFILIGVLGTPLMFFFLGAGIPFIAPVVLLETGPLSHMLSRAWYLGKKTVMSSLRIIVLIVITYFLANWLINQFLGRNTLSAGVANQLLGYSLLTFSTIIFTLLYYDARLRYDTKSKETDNIILPAAPEPIFTREDWRTVLRIAAIIGVTFVVIAVVLAVFAIGWLLIHQQQLIEGIAEFEAWLYASGVIEFVSTTVRIYQTLSDPESLAQVEQNLRALVSGSSELRNLEESITTLLDPETLAALRSSIDPAAGDLSELPNAEEVEAALRTLLSPENIQAIESAFGAP